jgi:hypothetical protein
VSRLGRSPWRKPSGPCFARMLLGNDPRGMGMDDRSDHGRRRERPAGLEAKIADALVTRLVESRFSETLMEQILLALAENRDVERLVIHLLQQPGVNGTIDELVDRQLGRVIHSLRQNEELRELVREQVDLYLKHLTANPEPVRQLIQDQSRGLVREILATVRARAFVADDAVDAWVRRALGRA